MFAIVEKLQCKKRTRSLKKLISSQNFSTFFSSPQRRKRKIT